jgi:DNA-binding transcriptional regulator YhcF (GntR family)
MNINKSSRRHPPVAGARPPLHETIAARIKESLAREPGAKIQSSRALAARYQVSLRTTIQALRLLRDQGVIDFTRGSSIRTLGAQPDLDIAHPSSAEGFYAFIRQEIVTGRYNYGERLPKLMFHALEHRISVNTVRAAYDRLVVDSLAHRRGKLWIVGKPRLGMHQRMPADQRPTIVLLMHRESAWRDLFSNAITRSFCLRFSEEADRHRIRLVCAVAGRSREETITRVFPCEKDDIRQVIQSAGGNYQGTLIIADLGQLPEMAQWSAWLLGFDKPVVWFDLLNQGAGISDAVPGVHRCYPDDNQRIREVISILVENGHRKIGMYEIISDAYFMEPLIKTAQEEVGLPSRQGLEIIIEREQSPLFENRTDGRTPFQVLSRLRNNGVPFLRRFISRLFDAKPDLAHNSELHKTQPQLYYPPVIDHYDLSSIWATRFLVRLLKKGATAVIAPNEYHALIIYHWCAIAGIRTPEDISLMALDSVHAPGHPYGASASIFPFPVSSVDAGYGYLAFQAFHALLRDIPLDAGKKKTIGAKYAFADRGSLGPPRKKALGVDLHGDVE